MLHNLPFASRFKKRCNPPQPRSWTSNRPRAIRNPPSRQEVTPGSNGAAPKAGVDGAWMAGKGQWIWGFSWLNYKGEDKGFFGDYGFMNWWIRVRKCFCCWKKCVEMTHLNTKAFDQKKRVDTENAQKETSASEISKSRAVTTVYSGGSNSLIPGAPSEKSNV